ncbi:MAG: tetratricopeptide repeat protein [Candidatus Omnitrophica bacterium]|nr:tetratricopeptide repeat protein [Candidatus Omnitrophota bacterium]MBU1926004.1 tetratricopeptide repeat protein [Candidatus Omnitrophota bacterium]
MYKKILLIILGMALTLLFLEISLNICSFFYTKRFTAAHTEEAPENIYRIICLGDSFTYGLNIAFEHNYPAQLEKILSVQYGGKKFKVYNFGYPDFTSEMMLQKFKNERLAIKPDAVTIMAGRSDGWNYRTVVSADAGPRGKSSMLLNSKIAKFINIMICNLESRKKKAGGAGREKNNSKNFLESAASKLIEKGNIFRSRCDYAQAIACYRQAQDLDCGNSTVFLELGRCYKLAGQFDKAQHCLAAAVEAAPDNLEIFSELDDVFIKQALPETAVTFYQKLLDRYPQNAQVKTRLYNAGIVLGNSFFFKNKFGQAISCYSRAFALDPASNRTYLRLLYNMAIMRDTDSLFNKIKMKLSVFNNKSKSPDGLNAKDRALFKNLQGLVKICKEENIPLIFLSYPQQLLKPMQDVAALYNVTLIDYRSVFKNKTEEHPREDYFLADGHCTELGCELIAEGIAGEIGKNLNPNRGAIFE